MATFDEENSILLSQGNVPLRSYSINISFTVPEAEFGVNYVQYLRLGHNDPYGFQFNVKPRLIIIPDSARTGTTVTISGSGFPGDDEAVLKFDGELTDVNITTNDTGSFTAQFTIPDTVAGNHEIIVDTPNLLTDTARATLNIISPPPPPPPPEEPENENEDPDEPDNSPAFTPTDIEPPAKPATVMPEAHRVGFWGHEEVPFIWNGVSEPNVTYTLEIADNFNFYPLQPGMKKTQLTQTSCTVGLDRGTYYWRVQAVDSAGNEGEWANSPYAFQVGLIPVWIFAIVAAILLLIMILLIRAAFRRTKQDDYDYFY